MSNSREDIEDKSAKVCKEGKASPNPENPGKVSGVLK
jgi:hypothetical protein